MGVLVLGRRESKRQEESNKRALLTGRLHAQVDDRLRGVRDAVAAKGDVRAVVVVFLERGARRQRRRAAATAASAQHPHTPTHLLLRKKRSELASVWSSFSIANVVPLYASPSPLAAIDLFLCARVAARCLGLLVLAVVAAR